MKIEGVDRGVPSLARRYSRNYVIDDIDDNIIPRVFEQFLLLRKALFAKLVTKSIATKILTAKSESFPPLDSRRTAWSQLASPLSVSLYLSFSHTLSVLTVLSLHLVATNLPEQG